MFEKGNGFIEDKELDSFLRELSSTNSEAGSEVGSYFLKRKRPKFLKIYFIADTRKYLS